MSLPRCRSPAEALPKPEVEQAGMLDLMAVPDGVAEPCAAFQTGHWYASHTPLK
ncbi:hypothetical protein AB0F39_30985 [Streptomyces murinus]|uniref:hypothetical protein n=1 Tax=Streptomyces murinus TaxID=33900 RepID=UPI0033C9717C